MAKNKKISNADYLALLPALEKALSDALASEISDTTIKADPASDLWDLPPVDSKTVCKLSPVLEKLTGHKLKVKWVKKGGYETIADAVADVLKNFVKDCVAADAIAVAAE